MSESRATVRKALIPCGGKGTRMATLTHGGAKELLPIGGKPQVLRVMEECAASGVSEVLIVSAPGKADLERVVRAAAGGQGMPAKVDVVVQTNPRGDKYGPTAIYPGKVNGNEFIIERIPDKGPKSKTFELGGAQSAFTGVGRYVFLPEVFDTIDEVDATLPRGKELDDIPVMQLLLARGRLTGCVVRADFLDVGLPSGYLEADTRLGET
jgi:UTP-glucose-1-phosphate uridylyltransferase